jgi:hypothetical protein
VCNEIQSQKFNKKKTLTSFSSSVSGSIDAMAVFDLITFKRFLSRLFVAFIEAAEMHVHSNMFNYNESKAQLVTRRNFESKK